MAERAIPLLEKKPSMGPKAVQEELQDKYKIEIPYQTIIYGRQRATNKLFGKWLVVQIQGRGRDEIIK